MKTISTPLTNRGKDPAWWNDKPTPGQLSYIAHIQEESEAILPPFTGTTKKEAADWINKNRYWAYHQLVADYETKGD